MNTRSVLVLAPHTDDGELGCGGTIAKYAAAGKTVTYVAFSTCAQSLPPDLSPQTLAHECENATSLLGISRLILLDFEVRRFPAQRQEILETLVNLKKELNPDIVFIPAAGDIHQDHGVIHAEALRAFKSCNVLGYELPWNNLHFSPVYFERLTEEELSSKQRSLKEYRSQEGRTYMNEEFIRSLAVVRGIQSHTSLAEAFEAYRLIN